MRPGQSYGRPKKVSQAERMTTNVSWEKGQASFIDIIAVSNSTSVHALKEAPKVSAWRSSQGRSSSTTKEEVNRNDKDLILRVEDHDPARSC